MPGIFPSGGGTGAGAFSVSTELALRLPTLGASNFQDLQWWTKDELLDYVLQGHKQLPLFHGFLNYIGHAAAAFPLDQYFNYHDIVAVFADNQALRPTTVAILEALSDTWQTDVGHPESYTRTDQGQQAMRLYPGPDSPIVIMIVYRFYSDNRDEVNAPRILMDALAWRAIQLARGREGDAAMPEASALAGQLFDLHKQMLEAYWG